MKMPGGILLYLILGIVVLLILLGGWIVIALTTKTLLTILLVGAGLYLFVRPKTLATFGPQARLLVPLALIIIGLLVYGGVFSGIR